MSSSRPAVDAASLVCRVLNTRCPVMAARMAITAVSRSRISPTMRMSGSCRSSALSAVAKPRPTESLVWTWLIPERLNSTGSSTVLMFNPGPLRRDKQV